MVGSTDFLEHAVADAYIGGTCGCQVKGFEEEFKGLEALLPFGEVYYNILADRCGDCFIQRKEEFAGKETSDEMFLQAHLGNPNPIVKRYAELRHLPRVLKSRLHIITTRLS